MSSGCSGPSPAIAPATFPGLRTGCLTGIGPGLDLIPSYAQRAQRAAAGKSQSTSSESLQIGPGGRDCGSPPVSRNRVWALAAATPPVSGTTSPDDVMMSAAGGDGQRVGARSRSTTWRARSGLVASWRMRAG
jgi:hypothetical protein